MIGSNKKNAQILIEQCYNYGIRNVVISPGSRNAPLILSFAGNSEFTCYSIADERSAGFYALGMARELKQAVAIICTSGTAVLNYAPALAEAYYQEIPIIAITADRPNMWIDQEDGQTIRQKNIFANYVKHSLSVPLETENNSKEVKENIQQAIKIALDTVKAPVHINLPFDEPLYKTENYMFVKKNVRVDTKKLNVDYGFLNKAWNKSEKIMIVAGTMPNDENVNAQIKLLIEQKNVWVVATSTSNLKHKQITDSPELFFNNVSSEQEKELKADLLITIGGIVLSKALKQFLRKHKPKQHIDIDLNIKKIDTYLSLTHKIIAPCLPVLSYINQCQESKNAVYKNKAIGLNSEIKKCFYNKIKNITYCDLSIYHNFFNTVNSNINLHLANSTPIRYAELFDIKNNIVYYGNRGTSGIDGCTSTAAGAAIVSKKTNVLITGDISFFYDSNALWNRHVPKNLKIILINNGGGNIFRILEGSSKSEHIAFFETEHNYKAQKLCEAFNVNYMKATDNKTFNEKLKIMLNEDKCTVLEVFTPAIKSAETYKDVMILRKIRDWSNKH